MPVTFHNADLKFSLPQKKELKSFIAQQVKLEVGKKINLSYIFCSDEYLLGINKQFLNHDFYTDIITFPLSEDEKSIEAEIYISIDRVQENSLKYSRDIKKKESDSAFYKNELHRVLFHGVLHLLGHKDKTTLQKAKMRLAEENWMNKFDLVGK